MDGHSAEAGLTKIDDNQVSWPFLLSFSLSVLNALLQADSLPILREWRLEGRARSDWLQDVAESLTSLRNLLNTLAGPGPHPGPGIRLSLGHDHEAERVKLKLVMLIVLLVAYKMSLSV